MRKLIRKGNTGFEFNPPEVSNPNSLANTGNVGATNALGIDYNSSSPMLDKFKNTVAPAEGSSALDTILPLRGGNPISLGDVSGFNKGFFSNISNFGKDIFKNMGGASGLISMGGNIVNSLLPEATQSKGLGIANNVLSFAENIPVYGKFATLAKLGLNTLNTAAGHTIKSLNNYQEVQDTLAGTGGGYGDFMNSWDEASKYSGKRAGFFDGNKYDRMVEDANRLMNILQNIIGRKRTDDLLTALMGDRWNERTMMDMNGGPGNIMFGRLGLKVEILPKVHAILNKPKVLDTLKEWEEVPEFKEGGKMNVIPEGSLHARLHHMENADGLTKKGIPVVSIAEGGELELQAEIELNEIIFNLEVTTELEKLMKDGSDNAAIEAGKLLVKEIFENTDDRTGLIKLLEPEKKEPTTEDIVKNHQVFLLGGNIKPSFEEWYKTVPTDRNNTENYNLRRAYELAPWEELERWRTATPELLKDPNYHLHTFYWADKDLNVGEFVKKNGHPTLINELLEYFTNKDFRENYDLDMSGEYFKYVRKKHD